MTTPTLTCDHCESEIDIVQAYKISKPEQVGGTWRIRRHDGELVGFYATKALAQRAIDTQGWLQ